MKIEMENIIGNQSEMNNTVSERRIHSKESTE